MSARYSSSPALHLKIGESRLRAVLHGALCLVCIHALSLLYVRGYVFIVVLLTILVTHVLSRLRCDPGVGVDLRWQQGLWTLEHAGIRRVILPSSRCTITPWVIYLVFSDLQAGPGGHLWLYVDSTCSQELRRLRVRLALVR